jgi:anti-sigma regulatory factor (Ser/Thr protein kinase)
LPTPEKMPPELSIRLPAKLENLPQFLAPLLALADAEGIEAERRNELELALEEALVNIFHHAYPSSQVGYAELSCRVGGDELIIAIVDEGIAFDVTEAADPDITGDIDARQVGGLGILLVKTLVDEVSYRREGSRNVLELRFGIKPKKEEE